MLWALVGCLGATPGTTQPRATDLKSQSATPVEHLIVLMQQNHTYDNYFGTYPRGDGFPEGLCVPVNPAHPEGDCIQPFHLGADRVADLDHSYETFLLQFNEGQMDGFVQALNEKQQDGSLAMGYYDDRDIPYYWNLADEYVLFDRFFSSAPGGSIWNRMFWIAGVPGNAANRIPEDGFRDLQTIFDQLQARGISWKFYINHYDPNLNYRALGGIDFLDPQIQWVPLLAFDRFIDDPELSSHIVNLDEYFLDLQNGTLPAVSYILALGATEHPLSSLAIGQQFVKKLIQALMQSDAWDHSAFLITYDDWGGWYDHVPPPQVDAYGYGFRVPALLISPYAKRGYVDSTPYDFTSILKFIQENWGLEPLSERSANANGIQAAFDFTSPPREPRIIPWERACGETGTCADPAPPRFGVIYGMYGTALLLGLILFGWMFTAADVEGYRKDRHER